MGKGEIARYEQFLLFPQCFQNTYSADWLKPGLVWERNKMIDKKLGDMFKGENLQPLLW